MEQVATTVDVVRGISDFGMTAMTAGFYLVISAITLILFIRWFVKLVNQIFHVQQATLDNIIKGQASQEGKLDQLKEVLTGEVLGQVRVVIKHALDSVMYQVCISIAQIKEENHLEDNPAVENKIRSIIENLYHRNYSDLDMFSYNGRKLSYYMDPEWLERVYVYCVAAVYDGLAYHKKKYLFELGVIYEKIRLEFFENLKKM